MVEGRKGERILLRETGLSKPMDGRKDDEMTYRCLKKWMNGWIDDGLEDDDWRDDWWVI